MTMPAASMGSIRPQTLLTRSWGLTPSCLNYRAGKCSRKYTTFAYRFFIEIPHHHIHRSHDPFRVCRSRIDAKRRPDATTRVPVRRFHQSSQRQSIPPSTIPHISLHIAASSNGKGSKFQADKSTYDYDPTHATPLGLQKREQSIFQKRRARPDSGQDSYFVAPLGPKSNEVAFGVCDGVGGWADHGIDPADFSHGLCNYMAEAALEWSSDSQGQDTLKPQDLLETAYQATVKDPQIKAGGSTACIAIADGSGNMRTANLGDSGFIQIRLGAVHQLSSPQTHAFNTPYQMSLTPPEMLAQAMIFGGLPLNDLPERADTATHHLQHGDVIVFATDGLWDNLSSQDILTIVSNKMRQLGAWERTTDRGFVVTDKIDTLVERHSAESSQSLSTSLQSTIAAAIVGEAKTASMNRKRDGPFAKAWQRQMPYDPFHGGKVDDITVLVVIPTQSQRNTEKNQQVKAKL